MRRFAIVGLLAIGGAACTHPVDGNMCVAGDQKACPCLGGGAGVQVCLGDGTYDVCLCPEMGVPVDDLSLSQDLGADLAMTIVPPDFAGVDLYGVDLAVVTPADFAGVDLSGVDLTTPPPPDLAAPPDFSTVPPDFAGVDLSGVDLTTPPPDLVTPIDGSGITCGAMTCSGSQLCCLSSPTAGGCTPSSGCDGGSPFACDGPEDCAGGQCCVVVDTSGSTETGRSYCMASCPSGSYTFVGTNGAHEVSILCHGDFDCTGYGGTILGTPASFSGCCHSTATSPYHVCIPPSYAAAAGYTCP